MQHLQPNTTLQGGKYRIERVLGQGGFGNTYVGVNTVFNERIAIKEFFMQGINDRDDATGSITISIERNKQQFQEQLEKFKKEANRICQLNNPHIVKVHDLFEENNTAYYVMDYVDGDNLSEKLKMTGRPMTESEIRLILPQILNALKTVHDAGIWHLDIKPANIMLENNGNVKLIDFGASKQLNVQKGGATTSTAISYTNGYAPREQMEQNYDKFGPWTDIYALGATLYNLLTNKRPPLPTDIDDDMTEDKHLALPFPNGVNNELKSIVLWMMKTNRKQRPQDINSIIYESERIDSNEEATIAYSQSEETIIDSKPEVASLAINIIPPVESTYDVQDDSNKSKTFRNIIIGLIVCVALFFLYTAVSELHESDDNKSNINQSLNQVVSEYKTGSQIEPVGQSDIEQNSNPMSPVELFVNNMNSCLWDRNTSGTYNFNYPDFMTLSTHYMDDVPGEVEVYSWESVQLAYWPLLGAWAVDSFTESDNWISDITKIANVTYRSSERLGIYSGYTTDGRIYYLKRKVLDGGEVPHATVLALIFPEEFKEYIGELIDVVRLW